MILVVVKPQDVAVTKYVVVLARGRNLTNFYNERDISMQKLIALFYVLVSLE